MVVKFYEPWQAILVNFKLKLNFSEEFQLGHKKGKWMLKSQKLAKVILITSKY